MARIYELAGLRLALATSAAAQVPPEMQQVFRLDPETGCYTYKGDAVEFHRHVPQG